MLSRFAFRLANKKGTVYSIAKEVFCCRARYLDTTTNQKYTKIKGAYKPTYSSMIPLVLLDALMRSNKVAWHPSCFSRLDKLCLPPVFFFLTTIEEQVSRDLCSTGANAPEDVHLIATAEAQLILCACREVIESYKESGGCHLQVTCGGEENRQNKPPKSELELMREETEAEWLDSIKMIRIR